MMRIRRLAGLAVYSAALFSVGLFWAVPSARAATLNNGDFSSGDLTGWTANAGFSSYPAFNYLTSKFSDVPTPGDFALSIGNFNTSDIPVLSQTFTTTPGATYTISFMAKAPPSGPDAHLYVYVDTSYASGANATPVGGTGVTVNGTLQPYTPESFSFVGTGSDTLSIAAYNTPAQFYVADFAIAGGVPEASTWLMLVAGFAGLGLVARGRRRMLRAA